MIRAANLVELAVVEAADDPAARARALATSAIIDMNLERRARAESRYKEALTLFEQVGDARGVADILDARAMAVFLDGDMGTAVDAFDRVAQLFVDSGKPVAGGHATIDSWTCACRRRPAQGGFGRHRGGSGSVAVPGLAGRRGDGPVAEQRGAHRTRADRGGQTRRCERRVDRGACRSPWLDGHGVAQHRYRVRGHRRPANRRGRVPPVRSTRASICRCFRPGHMRDLPSYWWPWGGSRRPPLMSIARLPWGHLSASSKHGSPDACSPSSVGNRTPQRCSRMRCTARPRAAIGPARPVSPC
jgi:hypothetical protein